MKKNNGKFTSILIFILAFIYVFFLSGDDTAAPQKNDPANHNTQTGTEEIIRDGYYYSREAVTAYIATYGTLPPNYITKQEARNLGWDSDEGNLWEVADGMVIGGDSFGNREGILPKGVKYYECDVNYYGGYRGDDRIVYSSDGNIYFTTDHYQTFEHVGTFEVKK